MFDRIPACVLDGENVVSRLKRRQEADAERGRNPHLRQDGLVFPDVSGAIHRGGHYPPAAESKRRLTAFTCISPRIRPPTLFIRSLAPDWFRSKERRRSSMSVACCATT